MVANNPENVKGLVRTDFNGAHWRVIVAGEVAGYFSQEQQAQERAVAVSVALAKRDAAFQAAALDERDKFLKVVGNMQAEEREMAIAMGALRTAAEAAENVLDSLIGLGPQVALRPRAIAALAALRSALSKEAR